jgi:hypothetical protein
MGAGVSAVARGCGTRKKGGIYIEVGLSKRGRPLEDFILCPPLVLPVSELGITALGVKLIADQQGIYHIFDVVGSEHYANPADYLEEGRRFGFSRRISKREDFALLTPGKSRLINLHAHGYLANADDLWPSIPAEDRWCPRQHAHHCPPYTPPMCASLYWESVAGGEAIAGTLRGVTRTMPSFSYRAKCLPEQFRPAWQLAGFVSLPITNIAIVEDPTGNTHLSAIDAVSKGTMRYSIEPN